MGRADPPPSWRAFLLHWIRRIRAWSWWRLVGLAAAGFVLSLKFVVAPQVGSAAAENWAERHGLDLVVEDWSADLWDARLVAKGVRLGADSQFSRPDLLDAAAVELDLSVLDYSFLEILTLQPLRAIWGDGLGALRARVHAIDLVSPRVTLEHTASGARNWEPLTRLLRPRPGGPWPPGKAPDPGLRTAALAAATLLSEAESEGDTFDIDRISARDLRIAWIQHLRGGSRDGIIRNAEQVLFLDDVALVVRELYRPMDPGIQDTTIALEARSTGGTISVAGNANLVVAPPLLTLRLSLDNVSAAAFSFVAPDAAFVPSEGRMTGTIDIAVRADRIDGNADLGLHEVRYVANPASPYVGPHADRLNADLADYRATRRVQATWEGDLSNPGYRPAAAAQQAVTTQGVTGVSPRVDRVARSDLERVAQVASEEMVREVSRALSRELARGMADAMGRAMRGAPAPPAPSGFFGRMFRGFRPPRP